MSKVKKPKKHRIIEIFDFKVTKLDKGESVYVVLPLKTPITKNKMFVKYNENGDIEDFKIDNKNQIFTAKSISKGICPKPGSNKYKKGLNIDDDCLEIFIEDGGANDQDNKVNGEVLDPNAIVEEDKKQDSSGGGAMGYGFVLLSIILVLFRKENVKKL